MAFWSWSRTAATNASADTSINWAEGQAPSSINDSARAMMARTAEYRDDIAGAIVTGGTSTAYTVTSYEVFDTLAHMNGQMIAFTPNVTNGATVTLNVDGLGAKPLRSSPGVELPAGTLIQGTPYVTTYNNSDGAWYLHGFYGSPYLIPLGAMLDYTGGATAPNSAFVLPFGQAISRSTYSSYWSLVGTTYGAGDGSTTFNVPDLRGRYVAGWDVMGGVAANRLSATGGVNAGTYAATGGTNGITLSTANLPPYTPSGLIGNGAITVSISPAGVLGGTTSGLSDGSNRGTPITSAAISATASQAGSSFTGTAQGGTNTAVANVPPTIVLSQILRII